MNLEIFDLNNSPRKKPERPSGRDLAVLGAGFAVVAAVLVAQSPAVLAGLLLPVVLGLLAELNRAQREARELRRQVTELARQATVDVLTGAYNFRALEEAFPHMVHEAERQNRPLSVIAVDLDDFKGVNDRRGHGEGNRTLRTVGCIINGATRQDVDLVIRAGGDELLVVLRDSDTAKALEVAQRIQAKMAAVGDLVTASFGVAQLMPGETPTGLLEAADSELYLAKAVGGDTVRCRASRLLA